MTIRAITEQLTSLKKSTDVKFLELSFFLFNYRPSALNLRKNAGKHLSAPSTYLL